MEKLDEFLNFEVFFMFFDNCRNSLLGEVKFCFQVENSFFGERSIEEYGETSAAKVEENFVFSNFCYKEQPAINA